MFQLFSSDYHYFFHQYLQTARLFTKRLNDQLAQHNLFHSQWAIVYYLKLNGPSTLVDISNYLNVEKPTITRTVTRLGERGLIEQVLSQNKREKRIQLSNAEKKYITLAYILSVNLKKKYYHVSQKMR